VRAASPVLDDHSDGKARGIDGRISREKRVVAFVPRQGFIFGDAFLVLGFANVPHLRGACFARHFQPLFHDARGVGRAFGSIDDIKQAFPHDSQMVRIDPHRRPRFRYDRPAADFPRDVRAYGDAVIGYPRGHDRQLEGRGEKKPLPYRRHQSFALLPRLLERAAREVARRAKEGDDSGVRVFERAPVRTARAESPGCARYAVSSEWKVRSHTSPSRRSSCQRAAVRLAFDVSPRAAKNRSIDSS